MVNSIESLLEREEGRVTYAYQDHLGYWTIGVGTLIDKRKGGGLRKEEIDFILTNRIKLITKDIMEALPWARNLTEPRLAVLQSMAFQMGISGLLKFKNTLEFVRKGEYETAANGMLASLWAKQTPSRAKRLAEQMAKGKWK